MTDGRDVAPPAVRPAPLVPLAAALSSLRQYLPPVVAQRLGLADAAGRILAEDVHAPREVPMVFTACRDGFAVAAADLQGASPYAPAILPALSWVESGEPLPDGCDAVIPGWEVKLAPGLAEVGVEATSGEGAAAPGEEVVAGTVLWRAGTRMCALDIALARLLGVREIPVRAPRVSILVVTAGAHNDPSFDALGPLLVSLGRGSGALPTPPIRLPGDAGVIAAELVRQEAELILCTGGTGYGRGDATTEALRRAGEVLAHGIACRPGTTSAIGVVGGTPVILLPGRLEDCLAGWLLLVGPCLLELSGARPTSPVMAKLARKVSSGAGFTELVLVRRAGEEAYPIATGFLPLAALSEADAYLIVPPASEGYKAGTMVAVHPLEDFA